MIHESERLKEEDLQVEKREIEAVYPSSGRGTQRKCRDRRDEDGEFRNLALADED